MSIVSRLILLAALAGAVACGESSTTMDGSTSADAGTPDGGGALPSDFFPARPQPFGSTDNAPKTIQVSVSAEALAQDGYPYKAAPAADEPVFVDGWSVQFEHLYVVIKSVRLNELGNDPSARQVVGALVAEQNGPWIVDGVKPGPITGAGGAPETAQPLFVFTGPSGGGAFDTTKRYAFSYATEAASTALKNMNLVVADKSDVEEMIAHQWSLLIVGTATYQGRAASAAVDPTFQSYPQVVKFRLGMGIPAEYIDCHNPELGEDPENAAYWGVQPSAAGAARAQVTFHTDHTFWDQLEVEGTPLHFDPFAARASGFGTVGGDHLVTLQDLSGVNPAALMDRAGAPVLDRGAQTTGYTPNSPPPAYGLSGVPAADVPDMRAFVAYLSRGFGHLNSDGECFVAPTGSFSF